MLKVFNMSSGATVEDEFATGVSAKSEQLTDLPYPSLQLVPHQTLSSPKQRPPFLIYKDDPEETATPLIH